MVGEGAVSRREDILTVLESRRAFTVTALARLMQVHPSTVYRWIYEGHLEAQRLGPHRTVITAEAVRRSLDTWNAGL